MVKKLKGDAYQVSEVHEGPPLSYVSEKLCSSIEAQHRLIKDIEDLIPDDFVTDKLSGAPDDFDVRKSCFLSPAIYVFHKQINTFLALHNRLGLLDNNNELVDKLVKESKENLVAWLARIEFVKEI